MAESEDLIVLDSSDPLNLIINNAAPMDDSDPNSAPPDWSQLGALWATEEQVANSTSTATNGTGSTATNNAKHYNDYLDFNMASNMLDMELDMSLHGTPANGIEPGALHLGASETRLGYPTYDDPFAFPASASPADILAAQFPFTFHGGDILVDSNSSTSISGLETPNIKERRLSVTSSSSSSGPSFSPLPESIPSPGYASDSTYHSSAPSFTGSEVSFAEQQAAQPSNAAAATQDFSGDPAAELAQRVRQSAGVMLAVPMNGSGTPFQAGPLFPTGALQTKLPIPRLQRPATGTPPKSNTSSVTSSAASTPPPSTPPLASSVPPDSATSTTSTSAPLSTASSIVPQIVNAVTRPKTSHTTIERRYRTNLNARIQSLRMAVPALRVLEDRDSGSSKKIKKNLKTGVLIKSSVGTSPHSVTTPGSALAAFTSGAPLNPYSEVDVIDERGYVDGVKVARKCSKANVLGKAVEYIRVLKRREIRLRAEQDGLKALICGLVGGPALLKEWEREWKERFGGEELEKDALLKKEAGSTPSVMLTVDGQPEKRKRGRPRKTPLPPTPATPSVAIATPSLPNMQHPQHQQPQQQYLLAVFALFSFFNSPLAGSSTSQQGHGHGHVLSPPPVPLAYAPEIVSQFNPPTGLSMSTITWRDWVQIAHLSLTVLLFISVIARVGSGFGLSRLTKLVKPRSLEPSDEKKIKAIILNQDATPSFTSALSLYRSLPSTTSPIVRALYLYTLASSQSTPALLKPLIRSRAHAHCLVNAIAKCLVKRKLGDVLGRWFVREVNSSGMKDKETDNEEAAGVGMNKEDLDVLLTAAKDLGGEIAVLARNIERSKTKYKETDNEEASGVGMNKEDLDVLLTAAKDLGGEVAVLARSIERVRRERADGTGTGTSSSAPSLSSSSAKSATKKTTPLVWKAIVPGIKVQDESESSGSDDSDLVSPSVDSYDGDEDILGGNASSDAGDDEEDDEEEGQVPSTLLRALVLYRSLFSSASSSLSITTISATSTSTPTMGVVGLTTALEIQQRGMGKYRVTVVADAFPGDHGTGVNLLNHFCFQGAHHVYNTRDRTKYPNDELYHYEKDTFKTLWELSEPGTETEECFLRMPQTEHIYHDRITGNSPGPEPLEEMPLYQPIPNEKLPPRALSGCTFHTVSIDTPIYLNWLFTRFIGLGGRTVRGHVQHLGQITEGGISIFGDRYSARARRRLGKVDAVIVCTGLATRALGGVEDSNVFPTRGQTVIVRAPWVRSGITEYGAIDENGEEIVTYIIPRRSSDVIVGGTRVHDDWYPHPREETKTAILTRALKLCPELAPPEIRAVRQPNIDDLLSHVVGEGCGLRPSRKGGIRIESEWWSNKGKVLPKEARNEEGKVLVVYNYGHAGYGYQSSWGTARKASDLLEEGLKDI
ncbi:D-amino-acid oxidase [Leucoagaricus sp. SymC.cos]|nr:D-amino-acid oxidase [Leucoagaricus sp. SymC.cos]